MINRLNAALRRQLGHGERGAATLEAVGMYAVAALLAVAVVLAALGSSPVLGDKFRQAVCRVTTLGQGECGSSVTSAADHKPAEPCVVSAEGHNGAVEANSPSSYGLTFDAEEIAKVGGGVTVETVNRTSTGATYWDGSTMVPWKGCGGK